jgi:cysteine synthase A
MADKKLSLTKEIIGASGRSKIANDVTEALGIVPIVRLNRIHSICRRHDLYLKLEACNPGGSIKEKNAAFLIKRAEQDGLLKQGGTIVESSSGNFGIGLAMVGAARGYRVIIVVDAKTPPPMRRMLLAYGAELTDVPLTEADANGSMQVARMKKAASLKEEIPGAWYPCQHRNPLNPGAHYDFTAREIEVSFNGAPDVIVVGVSTAGQIAGISKFFKEKYPATKIIGVDVAGSVIFGTPAHPYKMTGLGLSFVPPNYKPELIDHAYLVDDRLAFSMCHLLSRKEGLLLGASTGAIVAVGLSYALSSNQEGIKILMINPDRGDRYLETVYNQEWLEKQSLPLIPQGDLEAFLLQLKPVHD